MALLDTVDRARVVFHGTVQGVGFRYTTARLASTHPSIAGHVRNLPDGTVEVIAEGSRPDVEQFIRDIISRLDIYITNHQIQWSSGHLHHSSFRIVH